MFVGETSAYLSEVPFRCSTQGVDLATNLATNIRLGCKGLLGTKSLAYYEKITNYGRKSFIVLAPGLLIRSETKVPLPVFLFETKKISSL
jgi:hypothetical protein